MKTAPDGFDVPNLDCMDVDSVIELEKVYKWLSEYCRLKSGAMVARSDGRIKSALTREKMADDVYTSLPEWAKW